MPRPCGREDLNTTELSFFMSLIIQKYGGKALATADDIRHVARIIYFRW